MIGSARELSDEQVGVIEGLIRAPLAWQTAGQLAGALGRPVEAVAGVLLELESAGLVVGWEEWPRGRAWTFTPLAAERLGIRIFEVGPHEAPRWFPEGHAEPPAPRARRLFRDQETLGLVVDPSPGPAELAEIAEEEAARIHFPHGPGLFSWAWARSRAAERRAEKAREDRKAKRRARRNAQLAATGPDD